MIELEYSRISRNLSSNNTTMLTIRKETTGTYRKKPETEQDYYQIV